MAPGQLTPPVERDHGPHAGENQESGARRDVGRGHLMIQDQQDESNDPPREHDEAGHRRRP